MKINTLQPRRALGIALFVLLSVAGMTKAIAQVTLTQTSTSDFLKGTGQNVVIADDNVSMQLKMTDIYDFEATTNLPQTLMNHQIVTWQDYVFCVGGYNGSNPVNTVYRAQQQDDGISSWTTMTPLPVALTDMAVVATQQHLIVMGGKNDDGVSDKIYVAPIDPLNASLGEWTESSLTLPLLRWGARTVVVHDNIYLIGGATTDSETAASKKVYCLKLNSRGDVASISEVTELPQARNGHAVATYDSKIYVIGGYDSNGVLKSTVYAATVNLDGTLSSWATKTALPVTVSNHAATCTNGILAVIGGMGEELPSNQLYYTYLDGTQLEWITSSVVLSVRTHSGAACAFGDKIIFTGGQNLSGSILNFMRYASVGTGTEMVNKACYVSMPFDLGTPMKTIQQLSYNLTQGSNTSYEILYRMAGEDLTFGNWISAGTTNPISINETKSAIQYMFRLTATGTEDMLIEDMSVTYSGYTQLAGDLNDMSVLSLANSPYMVTENISFTTGIHDIEAGVVMYFMENTELKITTACVHFNGTVNAPILLTYVNPDQNRWNGVYFTTTSWNHNAGVYNSNVSSMEYTTIANAGYGENQANLRFYNTDQPTFTNCSFSGSTNYGIRMDNSNTAFTNCSIADNEGIGLDLSSSSPVVTSTTITGNDYGVYIRNSSCNPTFTTCSASGNNFGVYSYTPDRDFVYDESTLALSDNNIEIRTAGGSIYDDHTWNYYDNGYQVDGNINISNSSNRPTLTIAAGNTIRMATDKYISVNYGGIHAVGTQTDSITFTALNGQVGGWSGFNFYDHSDDNAASSLRYCVIEKANTNIYCEYTTQPSLMYSTVRETNGRNIDLYNSELSLDAVNIRDAYDGIFLHYNSTATMVMTSFDNLSHACVWNYDNDCTENFYTCSMSNSNIGVGYNNPNLDIPAFYTSRITFNNVTSPVGLMGGTIRPSRSWLNNDYSIFGNIYVRSNNSNDTVRLTIDPGSTLRFAQEKYMVIGDYYNEELYAEGIEEAPITFTSLNGETSGWNGLRFYSNTRTTLLKHCIFENGNEFNVYVENTNNPVFENCEFNNASGYGFNIYQSTPVMTNCVFNGNGNYGLYFNSANYVDDVMEGLQFTDNLIDGIAVNGGSIRQNRTWPTYDYIILSNMYVRSYNSEDTVRLTLNPGCTLRFAQDRYMNVGDYYDNEELRAEGTEEAPITFTSLNGEVGGWDGLRIYSHTRNTLLNRCIFENGDDQNVYVENNDHAVFENCEFNNANGYGFNIYQSTPVMTNCVFNGNGNYGLYFNSANYVDDIMEGLQFTDNLIDGIAVNGGSIRQNRTWPTYDYIILSNMYVRSYNSEDTVRLTLNPGCTLRFAQDRYMNVGDYYDNEELHAEGTEEAPITFTSLNGEVGGWDGLRIYSHTRNTLLKHCIFENGNEFNVYVNNTNSPVFENCEFRNSSGYGIRLYDNGSPIVSLSSIHNNANHGIYMNSNCNPSIGNSPETGNDIINNGGYAIYQDGSNDIDMAYNFFGTVDSLYIENNLVRDKLDYQYDGRVNVFPVSMLPVAATMISGSMLYDGDPEYPMEGSAIMVKDFNDELLYQTITDATGHFSFDNIDVMGAKKLEIEPNVDVEATITTADALAVMLHYVHEIMLTGSRLVAADVNGSFTVNGTDALLIQKRYVNQIETFPKGDVYYSLYDTVVYNNATADLTITALCYGDVNASYQPPTRNGVMLQTEGQMLVGSNQVYAIPVRVKTDLEAGAISLKLAYPEEYLSIEAVTLPNGEEAMLNDNNGLLTISWYSLAPMYLSNDEIMLTLIVRTKDLDAMEEPIVFSLDTRSELTDGNAIVLSDVELAMPEMITLNTTGLAENSNTTLLVYPNPMRDHSVIRYNLSTEGHVSFEVYDMLGNTVKVIEEGHQSVGQHEIELTNLASGVYVGRLVVSGSHEEVQMVKIVVE